MNFLFLMDPLESVIYEKDTTFILMVGAHRKGHKVFYLPDGGMTLVDGELQFHAIEVIPDKNEDLPFIVKKSHYFSEDEIDAVFIRTDPPFDQQYLLNTWLLDHVKTIPVINSPNGIRTVNEKIWAMQFTSLVPKTLISRHRHELLDFLKDEKDIIAKPTDGHGGKGVFRVKKGDVNINVIFETLTNGFQREIIVQKYIKEAQKGDKRILLLNGEPLGAVLRVHSKDDHRNNFFSGGKPAPAKITKRDLEIIRTLKPHLRKLGLYFVGIDILGNYLTEVNVTSPTCLQEMNHLYKKHLEDKVISFVEKLCS